MTEQALGQLARRVMLDAARLEYGEVLEEAPEHSFSRTFERRMKRLLRRGRHPVWYRTLHAAACLLLALLLSGCAVLAVSPEAREVFAGWVREVYYGTLVYRYTGPEGERPEDMLYRPLWLPEGYEVYDESPNLSLAMATYVNEKGEFLTLLTYGSKETMSLNVIMEEGDVEKQVLVAGKAADLYLSSSGETSILIWADEEKHLVFQLLGVFTEKEAVRIAESVRLMPLRTPPHRPGWMPEGYSFQGLNGMNTGADMELQYGRETGEEIWFYYWRAPPNDGLAENAPEAPEGSELRRVRVDGLPGEVYLGADGTNRLFWTKGEDRYWIAGPVSQEELVKIAGSIGKTQRQTAADPPVGKGEPP